MTIGYSDRSSYIREYAQLQGINLLMNAIERLKILETTLMQIVVNWQKAKVLVLASQVQLVFGTSADDLTSEYLVYRIGKLNDHLMSEFPHKEYALRLTQKCLYAVLKAIKAHSHLWNKVQLQSILTSLGSSYAIKARGLPYVDTSDEKKEKDKKKKEIVPLSPDWV